MRAEVPPSSDAERETALYWHSSVHEEMLLLEKLLAEIELDMSRTPPTTSGYLSQAEPCFASS